MTHPGTFNAPNDANSLQQAYTEISRGLRQGFYKGVFKNSEEFIQLLDEQAKFLCDRAGQPDEALEELIRLPLTEPQMGFLLRWLSELSDLRGTFPEGDSSHLRNLIKSKADEFERRTILYLVNEQTFEPVVFEDIRAELSLLSDAEKIQRLTETITKWEATAPLLGRYYSRAFANTLVERCHRELHQILYDAVPQVPPEAPIFTESFEKVPMKRKPVVISESDFGEDGNVGVFTVRQRSIALLFLAFGLAEVPSNIKQKDVIEFIHLTTGNGRQSIKECLGNLTAIKDGSKRSLMNRWSDLDLVRKQFERLGLSENVQKISLEMDFLLDEADDH